MRCIWRRPRSFESIRNPPWLQSYERGLFLHTEGLLFETAKTLTWQPPERMLSVSSALHPHFFFKRFHAFWKQEYLVGAIRLSPFIRGTLEVSKLMQ